MNIVGAVVTLGSMAMIIVALIMGWPAGDVAIFSVFATSGVNSLRVEAQQLLNLFISKYRKDHGLKQPKGETDETISKESDSSS